MCVGVLGYASLVGASLFYFIDISNHPDSTEYDWIVIAGGVCCGIGAALLWTAQGRLIMQYSDGSDNGFLFSIFWALFNLSALVGGLLTFFYFGSSESNGNATLYVIFLVFVVAGALATQLLIPPSLLKRAGDAANMPLIGGGGEQPRTISRERLPSSSSEISSNGWIAEMMATLSLFGTRRMLFLSLIFFYTGYNQPYQLNTFGNRFFTKKTVGLEMIIFYLSEIVGGLFIGAMLDKASKRAQRSAAKKCLGLFFVVTAASFILCYFQEITCAFEDKDCRDEIEYNDSRVIIPSIIYALWGFSDSQIQTYAYWLMGTLYEGGDEQARAVGFYKMVQSLGWTVGFALVPSSRMEPIVQMGCTAACFVVGTALAVCELPTNRGRRKSSEPRSNSRV
jgi:hypothetical protein